MSEKVEGKFEYEQDSKRFHRFQIKTKVGVIGTVYVPKDIDMPKQLVLDYAKEEGGS